jgi:hypothetical protein
VSPYGTSLPYSTIVLVYYLDALIAQDCKLFCLLATTATRNVFFFPLGDFCSLLEMKSDYCTDMTVVDVVVVVV